MSSEDRTNLLSSLTLVLWVDCLAAGLIGLSVGNPLPPAIAAPPPPVQAAMINVEVTRNHLVPSDRTEAPPRQQIALPELPQIPQLPPTPALTELAVITIPASKAQLSEPIPPRPEPATQPSPIIEQLTYGQGEGQQPSPEYPIEAAEAGEQGVVVVRFTVGEDGLVQLATVISPCRWPLLNRAAQTAIQRTWRFKSGPPRTYQVSIEFRLTSK
jgi:TonB family protein